MTKIENPYIIRVKQEIQKEEYEISKINAELVKRKFYRDSLFELQVNLEKIEANLEKTKDDQD